MRADHIRKYIPYLTIAAGIICALFYKCRYGYAVLDEAFYPTIGYRFSQGDAVLYEEWSNTQLYGVLMVPIIRAYIFVNGSTEGIYLFFRYLYTLIKIIFSIFVYFRLQRYGKKVAYTATLLFLIFTPYGLMVLSYNTIAFGGAAATLLLLLSYEVKDMLCFGRRYTVCECVRNTVYGIFVSCVFCRRTVYAYLGKR